MATSALKPCPNCGCDVTLVERGNLLVFLCPPESPCIGSGLGTYGMASKRESAIEAFNRRADQTPSEFERMCSK